MFQGVALKITSLQLITNYYISENARIKRQIIKETAPRSTYFSVLNACYRGPVV